MGGRRSPVRYYGYALLGVVVLVVAGLATMMAAFPGPALHPLIALAAIWTVAVIVILAGVATYTLAKSGLRRFSR